MPLIFTLFLISTVVFADPYGEGFEKAKQLNNRKTCNVVCGPNKEQYVFRYGCRDNEGRVFKGKTLLERLPDCRKSRDIICGDQKTGFTLSSPTLHKARGQYNHVLLGAFTCREE